MFAGSSGLGELGAEAGQIFAFNFVTINVYPLAPGMALVKHLDLNAKALPSNVTVPYDDMEIAYVKDGKYVGKWRQRLETFQNIRGLILINRDQALLLGPVCICELHRSRFRQGQRLRIPEGRG